MRITLSYKDGRLVRISLHLATKENVDKLCAHWHLYIPTSLHPFELELTELERQIDPCQIDIVLEEGAVGLYDLNICFKRVLEMLSLSGITDEYKSTIEMINEFDQLSREISEQLDTILKLSLNLNMFIKDSSANQDFLIIQKNIQFFNENILPKWERLEHYMHQTEEGKQNLLTDFCAQEYCAVKNKVESAQHKINNDAYKFKYIMSKKPILGLLIDHLLAANPERVKKMFLNPQTPFLRFIIKQPSPYLPTSIKRLAIYIPKGCDHKYDANHCILDITDSSNHKELFRLQKGLLTVQECTNLLLNCNAILETANFDKNRKIYPATMWHNLQCYQDDPQIALDYDNIHQQINHHFCEYIKDKKGPVELIVVGCGHGKELVKVLNYLVVNNIQYVAYGIDKDTANIETAKKNAEFSDKNVHFQQGDAKNIEQLVFKLREQSNYQILAPQTTITISSGFLTSGIISSQLAHMIFQKLAAISNAIFISGRTPILIQRWDAKNCGMNVYSNIFISCNVETVINRYESKNFAEQAEKICAEIASQTSSMKHIRLIGHARPVAFIKYLQIHHPKIFEHAFIIELQGTYLNQVDTAELAALVNSSKEKMMIAATGLEEWFPLFMKLVNPNSIKKINIQVHYLFANNYPQQEQRMKIGEGLHQRAKKYIGLN